MTDERIEYVVDLEDLAYEERPAMSRLAVEAIADDIVRAETDLPWPLVSTWPDDVREAAERLRDRFVSAAKQNDEYMTTGVQEVTDEVVRRDFVAVAPYTYDASFWTDGSRRLAHLADEGDCCILTLTAAQRAEVTSRAGEHRVVTMTEWRRRCPSLFRRLVAVLRSGLSQRSG